MPDNIFPHIIGICEKNKTYDIFGENLPTTQFYWCSAELSYLEGETLNLATKCFLNVS